MLTIKCARCKSKVLKYQKIGLGKVLRCYIKRIKIVYGIIKNDNLFCANCNNIIGKLHKGHFNMNAQEFTSSGQKIK